MGRSITEGSVDDLLMHVLPLLLESKESIRPTKGRATELRAADLNLTNPRARLSRSETRGRLFSCLGELCWYLSGSDRRDAIAYYISHYANLGKGDAVPGAYGPRFRAAHGIDQIQRVVRRLRDNVWSRRAMIQILDPADLVGDDEPPCTCAMQFFLRDSQLEMLVYMRSNDVHLGFPHDVFAFTMLQELVARSLGAEPGLYTHFVGNLHLYERDRQAAQSFVQEGWQSNILMPPMPAGDPWESVEWLLGVEHALRAGADPLLVDFVAAPYWSDLARLLAIHALIKQRRAADIPGVRSGLSTSIYDIFITDRLNR